MDELARQHRPHDPIAGARRLADRALHHPWSELTIVALILVSVFALLAEVAFQPTSTVAFLLNRAGDVITLVFVAELSLRAWVAPSKRRFLMRYWTDILAVLPVLHLEPLRLFRVLLLLRIFRAGVLLNRRVTLVRSFFSGALKDLVWIGTVTTTIVLACGVALHVSGESLLYASGTAEELRGTLQGSLWYAIYTFIGGEPIGGNPASPLGRLVTLILMLGGLTVFGMAVGTVSASMALALSKRLEAKEMDLDELSGHVVICGWNRSGPTLVRELFGTDAPRGRAVVLISEHTARPEDLDLPGVPHELVYHHTGDYTRIATLKAAGVERASAAILLRDASIERSDADRDARTVLAALTIERMTESIFCCAELSDRESEELLRMHGVEEIVVGDIYAGAIMGSVGRTHGLVAVLDDILTSHGGHAFHKVTVPASMAGLGVGEVHTVLKRDHNAILVSRESGGRVEVNPSIDEVVAAGDLLVVIADHRIRL